MSHTLKMTVPFICNKTTTISSTTIHHSPLPILPPKTNPACHQFIQPFLVVSVPPSLHSLLFLFQLPPCVCVFLSTFILSTACSHTKHLPNNNVHPLVTLSIFVSLSQQSRQLCQQFIALFMPYDTVNCWPSAVSQFLFALFVISISLRHMPYINS